MQETYISLADVFWVCSGISVVIGLITLIYKSLPSTALKKVVDNQGVLLKNDFETLKDYGRRLSALEDESSKKDYAIFKSLQALIKAAKGEDAEKELEAASASLQDYLLKK